MERSRKKQSRALRSLLLLTVLLAVACAAVAIFVLWLPVSAEPEPEIDEAAQFAPGITVNGQALADMSIAQARTVMRPVEQQLAAEIQFVLEAEATSLTLTHADFAVTFNTEQVLSEALALGNSGTRQERTDEREQIVSAPRAFAIDYTIDASALQEKIAALAQAVNTLPVDATVQMDMQVEGFFNYTEGTPGSTLDEQALISTLEQRAAARVFGRVELPLILDEPAVSVDTLRASLVLRAKAETSFKKDPYNREDRVFNVKRAASLVNGFVLKPGEVFSTNDTLGPRTYELGWKPAPAYVRGTTEDQAGGGVCQVSSTLYAVVVKSDLEIVFRRNHSSPVGYIARGLDATINTGTIDFQFKNNTASDIYIFAYAIDSADGKIPEGMDDKTVHMEIYGEPFSGDYDEIKLEAELVKKVAPSTQMEVVVDTTKAYDYYEEKVARKDGAIYQSYKVFLKNGAEVRREELAKSTYTAWAGQIIVGPGYNITGGATPTPAVN